MRQNGSSQEKVGVVPMAAMKPRTGDGPLEVEKEGRTHILRIPVEGGGRLVISLSKDEVQDLADTLLGALK